MVLFTPVELRLLRTEWLYVLYIYMYTTDNLFGVIPPHSCCRHYNLDMCLDV